MQLSEGFKQPENFDPVADGSGWVMYAGANDWEVGTTAVSVIFPSDEQNQRVWMTVKQRFDGDAEAPVKEHPAIKEHGDKAWRTWKREAIAAYRNKNNGTRTWMDAFKAALKTKAMSPYVKDWGIERTKWDNVKEHAGVIVAKLLESDVDDPSPNPDEIDRLLPTKTFTMKGSSLLHAPGLIDFAKRRWRERSRKAKQNALDILKAWQLPQEDAEAILNGKATIETQGDDAVVTIQKY
jgi:hypothetical protein